MRGAPLRGIFSHFQPQGIDHVQHAKTGGFREALAEPGQAQEAEATQAVVDADHHHIAVFRQIGKLVVDRRQRTDAREASAVAVFPRMCRKRTGTSENNLVPLPPVMQSTETGAGRDALENADVVADVADHLAASVSATALVSSIT